jgi:hypothetical protein
MLDIQSRNLLHEDTFSRSILPVQLYGSTYSTDVCILVQQNILRILTAEIANLLRPPKLQSGVLKESSKRFSDFGD